MLAAIVCVTAQETRNPSNIEKTKSFRINDNRFTEPLPEDAPLIYTASAAVRATPKVARLWKNYWSSKQPFLIYIPGKSALLISGISPPENFKPLNPKSLPRELRGKAYVYRGALPGLNGLYNYNYPIGEIRANAVNLGKPYETLALLFHEGFHEFQTGKKQFARTVGADGDDVGTERRLDPSVISNPQFVALMDVERRILNQAVKSVSSKDLIPLLRQYLAVRRKRTESLPADVRHSELNIERKEGSAAILGFEGAALSLGVKLEVPPEQLTNFLIETKSLENKPPYETFRSRAYGSGLTIAWLLTRMKVNWRQRLQSGASFESLLSEAVKFKPDENNAAAENALKTFDFAGALTKAELWKSKLIPEITIADFYKSGKVRLILEFSFTSGNFPKIVNSGIGLGAKPEEKVDINLGSQVFTITHPLLKLTSEKHPNMSDLRKAPKLIQFTIMLDELPQIEGGEIGKSQISWTTGGKIKGKGIELSVDKPAIIDVDGDSITVHLGEL
jgi:hypothetical protein